MWEAKKIQDFYPQEIESCPSCGYKARQTVATKRDLVLQGASPVKQYLVENISLQRSYYNIFGLTDTGLIR